METTIAAIASPPGGGLRGIIRVSGARAREIVAATWVGSDLPDLSRRGLHPGRFRDGRGEQPLLLLWMPGPRSFTREDVAEFHLPGSPPLLEAALARVLALGALPAAPGEFTRRAFLSGRIDLTRAEGVLALVAARNEGERRAGTALLCGGLSDRVDALRGELLDLRALVEASLDFEERDTGHVPAAEIEARARAASTTLAEALAWESARAVITGLPRVVLAGAPNAGKSSLFNLLVGDDAAIVSAEPGTTRDFLTAEVEVAGALVRLVDTAGTGANAEGSAPPPAVEAADLVLWVVDASGQRDLGQRDLGQRDLGQRDLNAPPLREGQLLVWNKVDIAGAAQAPPEDRARRRAWVATSAASGAGLADFRAAIARELALSSGEGGEGSGLARELSARHRSALRAAARSLADGLSEWRDGASLEILAEHLGQATSALDEITGATASEAVLDRIFARFCLGK